MDASLKDLIRQCMPYHRAPCVFRFGRLEGADVPTLIELARPTEVAFVKAAP